jgi:hypothetical protein
MINKGDVIEITEGPLKGLRAAVVRRSRKTSWLTLQLIDAYRGYNCGDEVRMAQYEVKLWVQTRKVEARNPIAKHSTQCMAGLAAKVAREQALAAGLTITTLKDGRLVQEKIVNGQVMELFSQDREIDT